MQLFFPTTEEELCVSLDIILLDNIDAKKIMEAKEPNICENFY